MKMGGRKTCGDNRVDGIKQIYLQDPDGYWIEVNDDKF
jgi:lactoylglutathione lyase